MVDVSNNTHVPDVVLFVHQLADLFDGELDLKAGGESGGGGAGGRGGGGQGGKGVASSTASGKSAAPPRNGEREKREGSSDEPSWVLLEGRADRPETEARRHDVSLLIDFFYWLCA